MATENIKTTKQSTTSATLNSTNYSNGSCTILRYGKLVILMFSDLTVQSGVTPAHASNVFSGVPTRSGRQVFLTWSSNTTASTSFRLAVSGTSVITHYSTPIEGQQYYGMAAYLTSDD